MLPDLEMVLVTNAGSNELFVNCELLRILRKYFGKEFQAADSLPEIPEKRRKLEVLERQLEESAMIVYRFGAADGRTTLRDAGTGPRRRDGRN